MEKLNYSSTDLENLDYNYGCYPAAISCLLAIVSFFDAAALVVVESGGLWITSRVMEILGCGLVLVAWYLAVVALRRRRGAWTGAVAVVLLAPSTLVFIAMVCFTLH